MLKGNKTIIRPLESSDLEILYEWYNDYEYSHWISGGWPVNTLLRREQIEKTLYEEDPYRYAITTMENHLIGTLGFDEVNIPARSAKVFIGIGLKEYWGKGFGQDALKIFLNYLFNYWNFNRLTAETWEGNKRAIHCYEKLGFQIEGRLREAYYINGKYYDVIVMGLLRKDYDTISRNIQSK